VRGHGQAEHGVAEELESLVRLEAGMLGAPRPVGQGELEQREVGERATEPVGEAAERVGVEADQPSRLTT
jgi:hypothetical protein